MIGTLKQLTQQIVGKRGSSMAMSSGVTEGVPGEQKTTGSGEAPVASVAPIQYVTVCAPKGNCVCNCTATRQALEDVIQRRQLPISVGNAKVGCSGKCEGGPFIGFPEKGYFYLHVQPENVSEIVEETLVKGYVLFPYLSVNPERSYRNDLIYEKHTGMIGAINDQVCMVQVAKYFMDFEEGLSCGKCIPCRLGMKRLQESLDKIVAGNGTEKDLEQIHILCETMIETPHCQFAMASSRPVLSAITYFEDEFKAHVERQECPAGMCKELVEIQKKRERRRKKK